MSSERFKKHHIEGKYPKNKWKNHVAAFDKAKTKELRIAGTKDKDWKSGRIKGTKPGHTLAVTREELPYTQTGTSKS